MISRRKRGAVQYNRKIAFRDGICEYIKKKKTMLRRPNIFLQDASRRESGFKDEIEDVDINNALGFVLWDLKIKRTLKIESYCVIISMDGVVSITDVYCNYRAILLFVTSRRTLCVLSKGSKRNANLFSEVLTG